MITYPNQLIITIAENATPKEGTNERFIVVDNEVMMSAMRDLKPTTYLLWFYLNAYAQENGYEFALSRKDAIKETGISLSSYARAVAELKEKGYLVRKEDNRYGFYATPAGGNEL